jgi:hypothetical protein
MTKLTNQKILELALNSSDPLVKNTVDKLLFALKLRYTEEELLSIHHNYEYHHSVVLHVPDSHGEEIELSVGWKNESFAVVSSGHQYYRGTAADMICGEKVAHHYIPLEVNYTGPKT